MLVKNGLNNAKSSCDILKILQWSLFHKGALFIATALPLFTFLRHSLFFLIYVLHIFLDLVQATLSMKFLPSLIFI